MTTSDALSRALSSRRHKVILVGDSSACRAREADNLSVTLDDMLYPPNWSTARLKNDGHSDRVNVDRQHRRGIRKRRAVLSERRDAVKLEGGPRLEQIKACGPWITVWDISA